MSYVNFPDNLSDATALGMGRMSDAERKKAQPVSSPISGMPGALQADLERLLNAHSRENESNTPDFILANYMLKCLEAFETASRSRESWYGKSLSIGG